MSDFLTHLAARALAPPTLRPRTLSRFEAEVPADAPEIEEPQSVARAEVRTTATSSIVAAPPPVSAVTHEQVIRERTHDVIHEASTTRVVERREQVIRPETIERQVNGELLPAARQPNSRSDTRSALPAPRREQRVPDANASQPRAGFSPPPRDRVNARPAFPQIREAAIPREAEPVIHVSIGRVEVRATTSAAPPRAARRNAAMTIDDYVARKNAKGRP